MSRKLLLLCAACAITAAAQTPVVMISIDGLRPDYITQADQHHLSIPHLRRFVTEGTYADGVTGVLPTVTYPSHTTLVTGVWPSEHGIFNNTTFDPESKNLGGWYWYAQDIRVPTLWDMADEAGLVTASVGWPVSAGEKHIRYDIPEYWRANTDEDRKLMRVISTPGLIDEMEAVFGPYPNGEMTDPASDRIRTRVALRLLKEHHAQFLTLHLSALDHAQHLNGPFSYEACAVLEKLDAQVGQLVEGAREANPKTVVLVVSDHGFLPVEHNVNLETAFVQAGLMTLQPGHDRRMHVTAWKAAPWGAGGSAAIVLANRGDKKAYAAVKDLLNRLASDPANGIARVIDSTELKKRGAFPGASFAVDFRTGYENGGALTGPLVTAGTSKGMHGYFPDRPELRASFFALGDGIASHHDLGVIDMRSIAPTVARMLGVKLTAAELPALDLKSN